MKASLLNLLACCLTLLIATAASAQSVEIKLKDGTRWRGSVNDTVTVTANEAGVPVEFTGTLVEAEKLYIVLETQIAGEIRRKTIFRGDVVTMQDLSTVEADAAPTRTVRRATEVTEAPVDASGNALGVFVLPLDGPVGENIRHEEIVKIGEEADKYGRGQLIVLMINTNGGRVSETELIHEALRDIKKRHRVVAWIRKAISAGCAIAMACDEIYFMTEGSAGSVTTVRGTASVPEEQIRDQVKAFVELAVENGYSEHIARAMKFNHYMCSYDKDSVTGEITWYGDTSGETVLSDDESNLSFTSSSALACNFSKGTADTEDDLAELLDLPRWHEVSDYGRKLSADWNETVERAKDRIARLIARRQYYKTGGTGAEERIGALIQINKELLQWYSRCPNVAANMLPEKYTLEREIEDLRRQLAQLRRNR
jgi:ATP-dependent protease ClpP protease subunit